MGELKLFREALETNHTSQTQFSGPGANYCYGCPLRGKAINRENVAGLSMLHFSMPHYDPRKEYTVIVNGKRGQSVLIHNLRQLGRNRDGYLPPTEEFL